MANSLMEDIRSDLTKIFSEKEEVTESNNTYSVDDIIGMIAETLAEADGDFIAQVANSVLTGEFTYEGDSIISVRN